MIVPFEHDEGVIVASERNKFILPNFFTVCSQHAKAREVALLHRRCAIERLL